LNLQSGREIVRSGEPVDKDRDAIGMFEKSREIKPFREW